MSGQYEPEGLRFFDKASGRSMLLVADNAAQFAGWICWLHPDGQWVSLRKATEEDRRRIGAFTVAGGYLRVGHYCSGCGRDRRESNFGHLCNTVDRYCAFCGETTHDGLCPPDAAASLTMSQSAAEWDGDERATAGMTLRGLEVYADRRQLLAEVARLRALVAASGEATPAPGVRKLYDELLYAVSQKFPDESRHQTALRYIRQQEERSSNASACTSAEGSAT